jgi:hypothetical protein
MTFKRKWSPPGKLSDDEIQHVLALAVRDSNLLEAQNELIENLVQTRDNPNRDEDLLDDLWGKFLTEVKRVAVAAYPHAVLYDLYEVKAQLVERSLDDVRTGDG